MRDTIGRDIDYIRISVTDRCNMRCVYCMPEEGVASIGHEEILTYDEILRIAGILGQMGWKKIKITGGEPLVRKECTSLIAALKKLPGIERVTLTTNGVLLNEYMAELADAGIDGINVSLDTLDREQYEKITRRDDLEAVLAGIRQVLRYPDISLKINCVPLVNDPAQFIRLAQLARDENIHVRFIEMMPVGLGSRFACIRETAILEALESQFGKAEICQEDLGNGPARYYLFKGFKGKIGFISAMSHSFCSQCNRVRLTSDGYLKACLQYQDGVSLKKLIRNGGTDQQIREAVTEVLQHKPSGHHFQEQQKLSEEARLMAQIGG